MTKLLALPLCVPLIAAVLLAGCGINPGPVVEDHVAKRAGPGDSSGAGGPAKREDRQFSDPIEVVEAFLTASAAGSAQAREAIMRSYLAPGDPWKPAAEVKVVRVISPPSKTNTANGATVEVLVQHIGVLNDFGQLVPSDELIKKYEYRVVDLGLGYVLSAPPKDVLLSESGLSGYFVRRPLYFQSGATLVPDWRYMSTTLSLEQQSNRLVEWLYEGPSAWLGNAVKRLPPETRPGITQVVRNGDALVVDLSASPGDAEYHQLAQQLAKTLVVEPFTALQIKVQGQLKTARQVVPSEPKRFVPRRYALVDHRVRRLLDGRGASPEDMLPPEVDKNVVAAAFSRGERAVAVVQQESGTLRLRLGPATKLVQVTGLPSRISRIGQPHWLDGDARTLLFFADGGIYQTGLDGKAELKATAPGLTSMSVAPDGRRLVLVFSGGLVLATRTESGTITLGPNQTYRVPTMFSTVQSAAFGVDNSLIVAGADSAGRVLMLRMNLDGTQQSPFGDRWDSGSTIRHLVADPQSANVLFELLGDAYEGGQNSSPKLAKDFAAPPPKVSAPSFEG